MNVTTARPPTVAAVAAGTANYFSTPDSVGLHMVNGFEMVAKVTLTNWAANHTIGSKWGAAGQRSYGLTIDAARRLLVFFTIDGTTVAIDGALLPVFATGSTQWLRWVRDVGFSVFYYAVDQVNEPIDPPSMGPTGGTFGLGTFSGSTGWVQVALSVDSGERGNVFSSTAGFEVGAAHLDVPNFPSGLNGSIQRFIVRRDKALVLDFNASDAAVNDTTWVSKTTGEVWTKVGSVSMSPPDQALTSTLLARNGRTTYQPGAAFATSTGVAKKGDTSTAPSTPFVTTSVCQKSGRTTTTLGLP